MPKCQSYSKAQEPKNRGRAWKWNESLSHFRGFEHFNENLFYLPNILCCGGEEGIFTAAVLVLPASHAAGVLQWSHLSECLAAVRAPRSDLAQQHGWWKIPVLPSVACKMLHPRFHTGDSYSSCPLLKFNFIALPNNLAAKATDESEERRLMQYMLSLSAGIFGFFLLSIAEINATSECLQMQCE